MLRLCRSLWVNGMIQLLFVKGVRARPPSLEGVWVWVVPDGFGREVSLKWRGTISRSLAE